jgi:hypothetical protein
VALLAFVQLSACATVNYDTEADKQLTSLSEEINLQLITWENQIDADPSVPVPYDAKFYNKAEADVTSLEIRMESSQSTATDKLVDVFSSLVAQLEELRKLHQKEKAFSHAEFLRGEQGILNSQIAALMTFELSLKPSQVGSSGQGTTASKARTAKPQNGGASK